MRVHRLRLALFIGVLSICFAAEGYGQQYPTKPIRLISPFSVGGTSDLTLRALQKPLNEALKGTSFVECIPGGTTKMAVRELIKSDPDGHTLLMCGHGALMSYYYSGTYDTKIWQEMTIIAQIGEAPYAFFEVRSDSPFKSWSDLVNYGKKNPGKLVCAGPSAGGLMNLLVNKTAQLAGIEVKYVPYAGSTPSGTALLGGHADYRGCVASDAYPNVKAGITRGLAVCYSKRLAEMPDVPTFKELGIAFEVPPLSSDVWGPPNMPPALVNKVSAAIQKAMQDPIYLDFCKRVMLEPVFKNAQMVKEDIKYFETNIGPKLEAAYPRKK